MKHLKHSKSNFFYYPESNALKKSGIYGLKELGVIYNNSINTNFVKQVQWSPDGMFLLSSSNDNILRSFIISDSVLEKNEISDLPCSSFVRSAEPVYSYVWYPKMKLNDLNSCCFLASIRDHPIHLYDALTSTLRASYPLIDHCERFLAPNSMIFSLDSTKFIAGTNNMLSIHALHMYGSGPIAAFHTTPTRHSKSSLFHPIQKGIISSLSLNTLGVLAAGTFSSTVGIYSNEGCGDIVSVFNVGDGGVTQVLWINDYKLLVVSRKSEKMSIWDIRTLSCIKTLGPRFAMTQQRMTVDIWDNYIIAGSTDGIVRIWKDDILLLEWNAHHDVVSSVVVHPLYPLVATCSGSRKYDEKYSDKYDNYSDNDMKCISRNYDNSIKLWSLL
ncbi:hypothetical protein T552_01700 [Pneumocystis carinii B80]|uniref:Anaphase-promoting complex subunit 4 WD40 domain-containing protein n=1 Tax=Pneumocystis carinii (strain B80) TaxID=1408658 RepID=A0A0W4ZJC7_PNEC8|nr:hypothetical protein T552_01700 [Pneumocystis carinii B80]KTW28437.1 hypothetical protein T552_01700 [Pneumocystis carinii B80]